MTGEPEEEQQNRSSDNVKNFLMSGRFLFVIALAAVIVLFVAVGTVRQSAGDFIASTLGIVQRTFSPSEVYVGEISLDNQNSLASSAKPKPTATIIYNSGAPVSKISSSIKTTPADSKDKEIAALNDKINALQVQLSNISSTVPVVPPVVSIPSTSTQSQNQTPVSEVQVVSQQTTSPNPTGTGKVLISEIMAGADGNSNYEFIELYNAGSAPVDLTGWSVKKKSSTGSESSLVAASRLSGKIVNPGKYFLLGNENGYQGSVGLDVAWPSSYTLAYTNNSVVLYNNGIKVEEIFWAEIPKGQSFARTDWENSQFTLSGSPTPQNSLSP
ncbi:MAG: lamin tail domain-containing protein [Minisyncoccia bacterium]